MARLSGPAEKRRRELKGYLYDNMYRHPRVERMRVSAERCVEGLFQAYVKYPSLLPLSMRSGIEKNGLERTAADYIAGMTDRFALKEYGRLNNGIQ